MDHERHMRTTLVCTNGYILAVDNNAPKFPQWVATVETLNPDFVNVITAANLLYRTAQETAAFMEHMIEFLEQCGQDSAVPAVSQLQATIATALKIAREGYLEKSS